MDKQKPTEQIQKFKFFTETEIQDGQQDPNASKLIDLDIKYAVYIDPKLYFASAVKNSVFIFQENIILGSFNPYNKRVEWIEKSSIASKNYLITYGIDEDNNQEVTMLKFWDIDVKFPEQNPVLQKKIIVGKVGQPCKNYLCFSIAPETQTIALGMQGGQILFITSKKGLLTDDQTQTMQADQKAIKYVQFGIKGEQGQGLNLFYATDEKVCCITDVMNRPRSTVLIQNAGGNLFDVNSKGNLIGCPQTLNQNSNRDEYRMIYEFNAQTKVNEWEFPGEKSELRCFKNNYLIMLMRNSQTQEQKFVIYDTVNQYIAYDNTYKKDSFPQKTIPTSNFIYLITLEKQDKKIFKLTEYENTQKIENFFKKSNYDIAYRFAKNQNADPALLAEICRLHASSLYEKGEYEQSIKKYKETIGYVEPSYIIRQFLDVSHIEQLIYYLEAIHEQKVNDKHHTALLLNCYVKQQAIDKLKNFVEKQNSYSELFDIETAIKVCRELNHHDLALDLAKQRQQHEQYLDILIENKKAYDQAIDFIRFNIPISDKTKYILQFGQTLMKQNPNLVLELLKNLVKLQSILNQQREKNQQNEGQPQVKPPTQEEKEVYTNLGIQDQQIESLKQVTFRNPEEFLHLFVQNGEYLKQYLEFLTQHIPNLPNEKTVFHRLFEYYLEQYHQKVSQQGEAQKFRQSKVGDVKLVESKIQELLKNEKYHKKYDQNHLLVLFKMYDFKLGIIELCEQLNLREELLNFYITENDAANIIKTCEKYGEQETNLWVQALKHFCKPSDEHDPQTQAKQMHIQEILVHIQNLQNLSPLLILNILSKNSNIPFGTVKNFFLTKLDKDRQQINKEKNEINEKMKIAQQNRTEYKKLKTQYKIFSGSHEQKCSVCNNSLSLPTCNFMCGCSFHDGCMEIDKESGQKVCPNCSKDFSSAIDRKKAYEAKKNNTKEFFDKMDQVPNKFDVISEFLGKGLFEKRVEQQPEQQ